MSQSARRTQLLAMEEAVRDISNVLREACPPGLCFALLLFDEGKAGFTTYASNAQRADMIEALKETIALLEANVTAPHGQPEHPANKRGQG